MTPADTARALIAAGDEGAVARLILDVQHLVSAIDRGYFTDSLLPKSAFIDPLRQWCATLPTAKEG